MVLKDAINAEIARLRGVLTSVEAEVKTKKDELLAQVAQVEAEAAAKTKDVEAQLGQANLHLGNFGPWLGHEVDVVKDIFTGFFKKFVHPSAPAAAPAPAAPAVDPAATPTTAA
jgi:hypothetical protein